MTNKIEDLIMTIKHQLKVLRSFCNEDTHNLLHEIETKLKEEITQTDMLKMAEIFGSKTKNQNKIIQAYELGFRAGRISQALMSVSNKKDGPVIEHHNTDFKPE